MIYVSQGMSNREKFLSCQEIKTNSKIFIQMMNEYHHPPVVKVIYELDKRKERNISSGEGSILKKGIVMWRIYFGVILLANIQI